MSRFSGIFSRIKSVSGDESERDFEKASLFERGRGGREHLRESPRERVRESERGERYIPMERKR